MCLTKPHVPKTDVVDVEPEKEKATCVPPAPYPHRLRAPKKLNNHSEVLSSKPSCVEEVTTSELEFLHSIIEHIEVIVANGWAPRFEKLPPIEDRVLPSEEKPLKL